MIWAVTDKRVIEKRLLNKIDRFGHLPATGAQAAIRCAGVLVANPQARANGLLGVKYPFPVFFIETGECAIVAPLPAMKPKEMVN